MNYRQLGKSTLNLSEIGFGCMSLGPDDMENAHLLNRAIELGINFFDTADIYEKGLNEERIGKILKTNRKSIIIASKGGNQYKADGRGLDWNASKKHILSAAEDSLRRLQTDYIDLYQLHGGTLEDPIEETICAFEILKQQGKIRYYGISSIRPNVIRQYINLSQMVSVMMQYSLLDRRPEETCMELLNTNNIGILARGGLAKGLLINKNQTEFLGYGESEIANAKSGIASLSDTHRSNAQAALQFVLQHPVITSAVVGIRTREQLEDVAAISRAPALSPAEKNYLNSILPPNYYDQHR
jgi:aryl-alcohol dehydrogenase-like predicted oxidoreductase